MNQPIGIPSGWEERAAIWAVPVRIQSHPGALLHTFSSWSYIMNRHDWRVED